MKYEYDTHIITRTSINRIIYGLYLTSENDEPSKPSKSYHLVVVVATRDQINIKQIYNLIKIHTVVSYFQQFVLDKKQVSFYYYLVTIIRLILFEPILEPK
jgi:hypothetical protein